MVPEGAQQTNDALWNPFARLGKRAVFTRFGIDQRVEAAAWTFQQVLRVQFAPALQKSRGIGFQPVRIYCRKQSTMSSRHMSRFVILSGWRENALFSYRDRLEACPTTENMQLGSLFRQMLEIPISFRSRGRGTPVSFSSWRMRSSLVCGVTR